MADQLFIGIDSGTQGSKVAVFSRRLGKILAEGYGAHELLENDRGGREQHPGEWIEAIELALVEVLQHPDVDSKQVRAMAVSGQQHGFVPLDVQGQVLRPAKLWCDTETVAQCQTITRRCGGEDAVLGAIGNAVAAGFTASKILWLSEHEPANFEKLDTVLLPHDYLNFWLSGQRCTENGDASGTAYFDVRNRCWSEKLLNAVDPGGKLADCLPRIISSQEPCGTIRPELAQKWGLPTDVLIGSGGGDNMMAAIGTGNVRQGVVTASLGTSGTIYGYSDTPVVDDKGELAAFCSSSNGWLPLICTMNVTVATELVRELFELNLEQFNNRINAAAPGSDGITCVPFFNGERTPPLPEATASLLGMTAVNCTRENISRSAMEGVTYGLRYGLDVMERNGLSPSEIRLVGGGAKSTVWRQMLSDMFALPVISPVTTEAGALGAAIQAMWCYATANEGETSLEELCDRYVRLDMDSRTEPEKGNAAVYADLYQKYLQKEKALRTLYGAQ